MTWIKSFFSFWNFPKLFFSRWDLQDMYFLIYFIHLLFIVVLGGGTLWHLQKLSQYINYISCLNSPSLSFSFIPFSPHSWNTFSRYHFSIYIHVYIVFPLYSPSQTLPPPPPMVPNSPGRTCSAVLLSDFVKEEKKMTFLLV
jgi:hypothetical protein